MDCTPMYSNFSNRTVEKNLTHTNIVYRNASILRTVVLRSGIKNSSDTSSRNATRAVVDETIKRLQPTYNYSDEYGRTVLTDVRINYKEKS